MNHLSLFSGIGGFDLAAEWMGWENVAHVENNPFCLSFLKKRFPNTNSHTDINKFDGKEYAGSVDVVSGGFPCQPFSSNGQRKGKEDDRFLWPEMFRVIRESRPSWVVCENVIGLLSMRLEFDEVLSDLVKEGYEIRVFDIPAAGVGAPIRRRRVWICAHAFGRGSQAEPVNSFARREEKRHVSKPTRLFSAERPSDWEKHRSDFLRNATRLSKSMDIGGHKLKALGNSICPHIAYNIFKAIEYTEQHAKDKEPR
jgi:DNA (cytosine-5)-methyltransferase 1